MHMQQDIQTPTVERFLRLPEVQHRTSLGRSAIYELMKSGSFPASRKLGRRLVVWSSLDLDAWMDSTRVSATKGS